MQLSLLWKICREKNRNWNEKNSLIVSAAADRKKFKIKYWWRSFVVWFALLFLRLWRHIQYVFSYYALKRQNSRRLARPVEPAKVRNQQQVDLLGSIESADSAKLCNEALLSCVFNKRQAPVGGVIKAKCLEGDKLKNCKLALKGLSNVMKNYSC